MTLEPIHKFNGGRGATLCHSCNIIISEGHTDYLYCKECDPVYYKAKQEEEIDVDYKDESKYRLYRSDGLQKRGDSAMWIEWNEDGTFKASHKDPAVGRSLIIDGNRFTYTWLTTPVKEILEQKENFINFTTKNSQYKLYTINNEI
jgi:hypothetical protein